MINQFISEIGGPSEVAKRLSAESEKKVSPAVVAMWAQRDTIPFKWRAMMINMANSMGVDVPEQIKQGVIVSSGSLS